MDFVTLVVQLMVQWFTFNRVKSIKDKVNLEDWKHCPGKENPADLLSRGVSSKTEFSRVCGFMVQSGWPKV